MGTNDLIDSAFGKNACLYNDVLQCKKTATLSELRKAYHKRALLFHPDKQTTIGSDKANSTLSFQAVSAVYEILIDKEKRKLYDSTGNYGENDQFNNNSNNSSKDDKRWVDFFRSVFHEVASQKFDRNKYCGSEEERADVLKYYSICKGDLRKVLTCIVLGEEKDFVRWVKDIIEPSIQNGDVKRYDSLIHSSIKNEETNLVNASDGAVNNRCIKKRKRLQKKCVNSEMMGISDGLIDTDDECNDDSGKSIKVELQQQKQELPKSATHSMSKKDKMDFFVAKKRKQKKEKDIELANLINGKQWDTRITKHSRSRRGTFSDNLIASLEQKFSTKGIGLRVRKNVGKK